MENRKKNHQSVCKIWKKCFIVWGPQMIMLSVNFKGGSVSYIRHTAPSCAQCVLHSEFTLLVCAKFKMFKMVTRNLASRGLIVLSLMNPTLLVLNSYRVLPTSSLVGLPTASDTAFTTLHIEDFDIWASSPCIFCKVPSKQWLKGKGKQKICGWYLVQLHLWSFTEIIIWINFVFDIIIKVVIHCAIQLANKHSSNNFNQVMIHVTE